MREIRLTMAKGWFAKLLKVDTPTNLAYGLGHRKKRLMSGLAKRLKAAKRVATRGAPNKAREIARRHRQIERGMLKPF